MYRPFPRNIKVSVHGKPTSGVPNWSERDWVALGGGLDNSEVNVEALSEVVQIIVDHPYFIDPMQVRLWFMGGWHAPDVVDASYVSLKPRYQGSGIGTRIFFSLAQRASALGFSSVIITALSGSIHTTVGIGVARGAYTCGRLGFDAELSSGQLALLPPSLEHCKMVQDLMDSEVGIAFWKLHFVGTTMKFDLRTGSRSWKTLHMYRREHGLISWLRRFVPTFLRFETK